MKIIKTIETDTEKKYSKACYLDCGLQVEDIVDLIKQLETEYDAKLIECDCNSFREDGSPKFAAFFNAEDLLDTDNWPNPYVVYCAIFGDKATGEYKFNLSTSINSEIITYSVNKKKLKATE